MSQLSCERIAFTAVAGSAASVIGRPTTIWLDPAAIASRWRDHASLIAMACAGESNAGRNDGKVIADLRAQGGSLASRRYDPLASTRQRQ